MRDKSLHPGGCSTRCCVCQGADVVNYGSALKKQLGAWQELGIPDLH